MLWLEFHIYHSSQLKDSLNKFESKDHNICFFHRLVIDYPQLSPTKIKGHCLLSYDVPLKWRLNFRVASTFRLASRHQRSTKHWRPGERVEWGWTKNNTLRFDTSRWSQGYANINYQRLLNQSSISWINCTGKNKKTLQTRNNLFLCKFVDDDWKKF